MSRALLTDADRRAISGELDDANKRTSAMARVRPRIPRLVEDGRILREHEPDLYADALANVLPDDPVDRLAVLREQLERVEDELEND